MTYISYIIYIVLSILMVIYVGQQCHKHGRLYILNYFPHHQEFGNRLNTMLRLAYYLLNIGLSIFSLYSINIIGSPEKMLVEIAERLGFICLVIGVLHFNNIVIIFLIRNHFKS